mmetsp:Transcript_8778/g.19286  ORF Transcript_8778/g.19286 Transcript_8778/m.19286 type:complete len:270 (-) Transcript_8778:15-824(-)
MTYSAPLQQEAGPRAEQQPEHGLRPAVGGALKVPLPMDSEVLLGKEVDGEETQPGSSRSSSELSSVPGSLRSLSECESLSVSPEAEGRSEPKALEEIKVLRWDAELGAWVAHHFPELDGDDGDDLPLEDSPVEEEDITAQTAQLRAAFLGVEVSSQEASGAPGCTSYVWTIKVALRCGSFQAVGKHLDGGARACRLVASCLWFQSKGRWFRPGWFTADAIASRGLGVHSAPLHVPRVIAQQTCLVGTLRHVPLVTAPQIWLAVNLHTVC